jgi:triacylglycerol esterase/lipase EstA (alpha/beta hydrolase family)
LGYAATVRRALALVLTLAACASDAPGLPYVEPPPDPEVPPGGPYPIVLVHGFCGWNEVGTWSYYYGVADDLRARGEQVYVTEVDPFNSIEIRAPQLAAQLDEFLADSGAGKVNLIAHSQGGLDARWVITVLGYGDRVASLTTVATPHHGTYLAQAMLDATPAVGEAILAALVDALGTAAVGREQDVMAAMDALRPNNINYQFNPLVVDDPRVAYTSFGGETCILCDHPVNAALVTTYEVLKNGAGANDGIVNLDSTPWGTYLGTLPTDHFGEVGQPPNLSWFDHLVFYEQVVDGLRAAGF